jgi:hypothetical protein
MLTVLYTKVKVIYYSNSIYFREVGIDGETMHSNGLTSTLGDLSARFYLRVTSIFREISHFVRNDDVGRGRITQSGRCGPNRGRERFGQMGRQWRFNTFFELRLMVCRDNF